MLNKIYFHGIPKDRAGQSCKKLLLRKQKSRITSFVENRIRPDMGIIVKIAMKNSDSDSGCKKCSAVLVENRTTERTEADNKRTSTDKAAFVRHFRLSENEIILRENEEGILKLRSAHAYSTSL
jgi:hypothetical protein